VRYKERLTGLRPGPAHGTFPGDYATREYFAS
jgi:hypothetical protein